MAAGEGALAAQFGAMKSVTMQLREEMAKEQQALGKKYGGGLSGQAAFFADALGADGEEDGISKLLVRSLDWGEDGWPVPGDVVAEH